MTITTSPTAACGPNGMALIGRSLHDLRGIRFEQGEGGGAPAPAPAAPPAPAPAPAAPPAPAPTPAPAPAAPPAPAPGPAAPPAPPAPPAADPLAGQKDLEGDLDGGIKFADLDPRTQAEVRKLRNEAKVTRETTTKAQQEWADKVATALGIKPSADPADPAAIAAQAEKSQADLKVAKLENAVLLHAPALGANAAVLLDSRAFATKLAGMNPDDNAAISAAITEFIANNASAKLTTAGGGSGTGGAGTGGQRTAAVPATLHDAVLGAIAGNGPTN